jgi:tetratricopeptide (TPR) repeat protein
MSGGPVLNENGEVVGIHGRADTRAAESSSINQNIQIAKTGFNLGIPINTSLRLLASSQVDLGVKVPSAPVATGPKADDFFIQGEEKSNKGDYQGAVAAYTQAIQLNPNYSQAYNNRAAARYQQKEYKGAIEDLSQVLRINPNNSLAYFNRAKSRSKLGDEQGASEDRNKGLRVNPSNAEEYVNRGSTRFYLGDKQGAIADLSQALRINPNYGNAYIGRGIVRSNLGDEKGAIADYDQALRINPNYAYAYGSRGNARYELGDKQGAIDDYNQVLRINPNDALAYYNRGNARSDLGDNQGAIQDFQKAAELYQKQGNRNDYQDALDKIRQLENNTQTRPTSTTLLSANSSLIPGKSSALPSDGSLYEQHTFVGRAGQSVTITVESRDFDTYVALFSPDGKLLAENDDISRSNTNSALTVTLPTSGRYTVVVNANKKGERGRYNLTVR